MSQEKPTPKGELSFCLKMWETKGECKFAGKSNKCSDCGTPYVMYKLITGKVLHTERRFTLKEWKEILNQIEN